MNAGLRHARYVITENPVTLLAFGLLVLIVLVALLGPCDRALRSRSPPTPRGRSSRPRERTGSAPISSGATS